MNLSEINTLDELVLQLARLGFAPVEHGEPSPYRSHYWFIDWFCPLCQSGQRGLSIWPPVDVDSELTFDDMGITAVSHGNEIVLWEVVESFAGTSTPIRKPEEIELDRLGDFLTQTLESWEFSKQ